MAIGTGIAIGLGLAGIGTKAATDIYAAKKASSASKEAAAIQTRAADDAQRITDDIYAPYLNRARTASTALGRLVTPGPSARYAAPDPGAPTTTPVSRGAVPRRSGMGARAGLGSDGSMPNEGMTPRPPRMLGGSMRRPEMVLMEADGETRPVPADQVARFEAAGARRVM